MIRISFINFWKNPDTWKYFTHFIEFHCKTPVIVVKHYENPDILFCSCFNYYSIRYIQSCKATLKIFYTSENLSRYPPYNDTIILDSLFHLKLGFFETNIQKGYIRFPLWLLYSADHFEGSSMLDEIQQSFRMNSTHKNMFASLISRHDRNGQRKIIYDALSKYGPIKCPGICLNNCGPIGSSIHEKIQYIQHSKFNICPENSSGTMYWTEKIFEAFKGGTIPLYWSNQTPEPDIIQRKSYVNCNIHDKDILEFQIKSIVQSYDKRIQYIHTNGLFTPQSKYVVSDMYQQFKYQLFYKLNYTKQLNHFLYFHSNRNLKQSIQIIPGVHNAIISNPELHRTFISKLVHILSILDSISYNDCLICLLNDTLYLNPYDSHTIQFILRFVQNTWNGVMVFKHGVESSCLYTSDFFVLRKNEFSIFFIQSCIRQLLLRKEWWFHIVQDLMLKYHMPFIRFQPLEFDITNLLQSKQLNNVLTETSYILLKKN